MLCKHYQRIPYKTLLMGNVGSLLRKNSQYPGSVAYKLIKITIFYFLSIKPVMIPKRIFFERERERARECMNVPVCVHART